MRMHTQTTASVVTPVPTGQLLTFQSCDIRSREQFPCTATQVLNYHTDEVWFCRFSPDGSKLTTESKDGVLTLWDVDVVRALGIHRTRILLADVG